MAGKIQDQVQQASSIQRNQVLEDFRWAVTSRHASLMGRKEVFMGKAKFSKHNRIKLNLIGLALAVLFHGAYDFFLFINFIP